MTAKPKALSFPEKVQNHWTSERLKKLTSGHRYAVLPTTAPALLRTLGILNQDASMSADAAKKYIQINHLFSQFRTFLEELNSRHKLVRILDAGSGSSYLTFLLAWAYRDLWQHPALLIGIDSNKALISKVQKNATDLDMGEILKVFESSIADFDWYRTIGQVTGVEIGPEAEDRKTNRPHAVIALHACDTATDDAIALGINYKSDFIAVAPCCQAELSRLWKGFSDQGAQHPLKPAFQNPHLRREIAAHMTDLLRVLLLRANGYEVTTTEFTMSHATPKNTLLLAVRRGNFHAPSREEYDQLVKSLNGSTISLASKVKD